MEVNLTSIETTLRDIMLTKVGQALKSAGGIEMESGDFTLEEDASQPTISFSDTHEKPPALVIIQYDTNDDSKLVSNQSMMSFLFLYIKDVVKNVHVLNGVGYWGFVAGSVYYNGGQGYSGLNSVLHYTYAQTSFTGKNSPGTYVTKDAITPIYPSGATARYYTAGIKYKWFAYWLPETESEG